MIDSIPRAAGFLLIAVSAIASAQAPPPPAGAGQPAMHVQGLNVYPKNGQTQDQQWADRYACDSWSKTQSGFDPAQAPSGLSSAELASRHDQYRRAMSACLDAHGYTVTAAVVAVAAAAPPPPSVYVVPTSGFKYHSVMMQIEGGYTATQGDTAKALEGGWNAGLGLTWYPFSSLPVGLRLDASYSRFDATSQTLSNASQFLGANVSHGVQDVYGADLDLQFDFTVSQHTKWYFFGGGGRYRESVTFQEVNYVPGYACDFYFCYPGYIPVASTVAHDTSGWLNSWNAGTGFEFALQDPVRFFVEARYQRIGSNMSEFVPIRVGLRF
jgi:Outer membrane protein beta-barrel domain